MKSIRNAVFFRTLVLAVGILGASATSAYAQSANGAFTLTHQTRWGGMLLAPGEYKFSLESPSFPAQINVEKVGGGQLAIVLPQGISSETLTDGSKLILDHDASGESFVSALDLEELGVRLVFATPKARTPVSETAWLGPIAEVQSGK
jgi:hypothetical protein